MDAPEWHPVTHEHCRHIEGPFYHGTKSRMAVGEYLIAGQRSNFEDGRISNHVYFSAKLESAIWGAELAVALANASGRGCIYVVRPTGTFEDDPNLTNKKFPGNPTRSYRTREPVEIVGVVEEWDGHPAETLQMMLDSLADRRRRGLTVIED